MRNDPTPRELHAPPPVSDIAIEQRCRTLIDKLGPFPDVTVSVSHGWVSLSGQVAYANERWKVEHAIGQLERLAGVSAQITVVPGAGGAA